MLDYLEIKNFRSCEDVRLLLGEPVVALLGKNGSGKTNLLHSIQLAAELCVGEAEPAFSLHPRNNKQPTTLALGFSIGSESFEYRTSRSTYPSPGEILEESLTRDGIPIVLRNGDEIGGSLLDATQAVRLGAGAATLPTLLQIFPHDHSVTKTLKPVIELLRAVNYYSLIQGFQEHVAGPQRLSLSDQLSGSSPFIEVSKYRAWKSEFEQGRARRSVQMRLLYLHLEDGPSFSELKALLGNDGLGLLADIQIDKVQLGVAPESLDPEKLQDEPEGHYLIRFVPGEGLAGAGRTFQFSGLSAGTWRILQLLTYLVCDKNSCMLLEQPEDSVHSGLLAKVIDILRTYSGRTQLICTTHSSRVMDLVGAEGIRLVAASNGSTSVESLSASALREARNYLQDLGTLSEFLETL